MGEGRDRVEKNYGNWVGICGFKFTISPIVFLGFSLQNSPYNFLRIRIYIV